MSFFPFQLQNSVFKPNFVYSRCYRFLLRVVLLYFLLLLLLFLLCNFRDDAIETSYFCTSTQKTGNLIIAATFFPYCVDSTLNKLHKSPSRWAVNANTQTHKEKHEHCAQQQQQPVKQTKVTKEMKQRKKKPAKQRKFRVFGFFFFFLSFSYSLFKCGFLFSVY